MVLKMFFVNYVLMIIDKYLFVDLEWYKSRKRSIYGIIYLDGLFFFWYVNEFDFNLLGVKFVILFFKWLIIFGNIVVLFDYYR